MLYAVLVFAACGAGMTVQDKASWETKVSYGCGGCGTPSQCRRWVCAVLSVVGCMAALDSRGKHLHR